MLSNLVISSQRLVLVIDERGQEKIAQKFICQLLREQGQDEINTKTLPLTNSLKEEATFNEFVKECEANNNAEPHLNVVLPTLADLLSFQRPAVIFQFINKLRKAQLVKRTFLWASTHHLMHTQANFFIAACEYMADLILHLELGDELSIITRKPGGGVTNKRFTNKITKNEFLVVPLVVGTRGSSNEAATPKKEQLGTFKIELDEDELVARNALKLPYEKTSDSNEGNIVYTPDAIDDFDDEDPDEDLCI